VTEIYARAGEPITFSLTAGGCAQNTCPMDKEDLALCSQARSFTPTENADYVATIMKEGQTCDIHLYRIEAQGKRHVPVPEPSLVVTQCPPAN